jgi:hypothetical protein
MFGFLRSTKTMAETEQLTTATQACAWTWIPSGDAQLLG